MKLTSPKYLAFAILTNAICSGNTKCDLVGGVEVVYPASNTDNWITLSDWCSNAMNFISDGCGADGGYAECNVSNMHEGTLLYALYPYEADQDPCNPAKWEGTQHSCAEIPCETFARYCDGRPQPPL